MDLPFSKSSIDLKGVATWENKTIRKLVRVEVDKFKVCQPKVEHKKKLFGREEIIYMHRVKKNGEWDWDFKIIK